MKRLVCAIAILLPIAGCVKHLPESDLRIVETPLTARLSADALWQEYQTDERAADERYWGKAIEVTGTVTAVMPEYPIRRMRLATQDGAAMLNGVHIHLLLDYAALLIPGTKVGDRLTLKCFCEGLQAAVVLRSCIPRAAYVP